MAVLRNKATGEMIYVDGAEMRILRMRSRMRAWGRAVNGIHARVRVVGITLTYAAVGSWEASHIRDYMRRLRQHLGPSLYAYAWVAELQDRGAVHYHVCLVVAPGSDIPKPDLSWWKWGSLQIKTLSYASGQYLMKYGQKALEGGRGFPKGLRLYACVIRKESGIDAESFFWFRRSAAPPPVKRGLDRLSALFGGLYHGWTWRVNRAGWGWVIEWNGTKIDIVASPWEYMGEDPALIQVPEIVIDYCLTGI